MAKGIDKNLLRQTTARLGAFARELLHVGLALRDSDDSGFCACALHPEGNGSSEACRSFAQALLQTGHTRERCPRGLSVLSRPVMLSENDRRLIVSHGFLADGEAKTTATMEVGRKFPSDLPRLNPQQIRLLEDYLAMAADLIIALTHAVQDPAQEASREELWREELGAPSIVGVSQAISAVREALPTLANSREPLYLDAEPGCGRHLIASTIHRLGPRRGRPFLAEHLSVLPDTLQESELFGQDEHPGLLETAAGGTLFLSGVERLSAVCQRRLFDLLTPGGAARSQKRKGPSPDVRIIAAADVNLDEAVRKGRFRSDLSRRLGTVTLDVPPLRERPEDIPPLVEHLLRRRAAALRTAPPTVDPEALAALKKYQWPGNVRELGEVLAAAASGRAVIRLEDLNGQIARAAWSSKPLHTDLRQAVGEVEMELIARTLGDTNWNKSQAARILGLSRLGLQKKIDRYDLDRRR